MNDCLRAPPIHQPWKYIAQWGYGNEASVSENQTQTLQQFYSELLVIKLLLNTEELEFYRQIFIAVQRRQIRMVRGCDKCLPAVA